MSRIVICALRSDWVDDYYHEGHCIENLGIGWLASVLRVAGHYVLLLDGDLLRLSDEQLIADITAFRPNLVCFSELSSNIVRALSVARRVKSAIQPTILFGDYYATMSPESLLLPKTSNPDCVVDGVVAGDGEVPLELLANAVDAGRIMRALRDYCYTQTGGVILPPQGSFRPRHFSDLPPPARDFLATAADSPKAVVSIIASRGCTNACTFCTRQRFGGITCRTWEGRTPEDVVAEMDSLAAKYSVRDFFFFDDNFVGPRSRTSIARLRRFAALLESRDYSFRIACRADSFTGVDGSLLQKLRRVGLYRVFVGVESGCDSQLRRYGKALTRAAVAQGLALLCQTGFAVHIGFIMFDEHMSRAEFCQNVAFLRAIGQLHFFRNLASCLSVQSGMEYKSAHPVDALSLPDFVVSRYPAIQRLHDAFRPADHLWEYLDIALSKRGRCHTFVDAALSDIVALRNEMATFYEDLLQKLIFSACDTGALVSEGTDRFRDLHERLRTLIQQHELFAVSEELNDPPPFLLQC